MDGDALGVEGSYPGGCEDDVALVRALRELMQEGGLAGAGLACQEYVPSGTIDETCRERGHFRGLQSFGGHGPEVRTCGGKVRNLDLVGYERTVVGFVYIGMDG